VKGAESGRRQAARRDRNRAIGTPQVCVEHADWQRHVHDESGTNTDRPNRHADGTDRQSLRTAAAAHAREWSADGLRLYARAELTCKGDQGMRRVSDSLLGPNGGWTDVRSVDIGGQSFRVRQYRHADDSRVIAWYRSHGTDARRCEGSEREGLATRARGCARRDACPFNLSASASWSAAGMAYRRTSSI
jgi:hypothetical protein